MKLPPYPRIKPSGVEWLGNVPEHWETRRLKDVGTLRGGAGFPHEEQGIEDEELPFYKVGDLKASLDGRVMGNPEHTISKETAKKLRAAIVPPDSIVYAKIGAALLLNRRRVTFVHCCIDNNMTAYLPDKRRVRSEWAFYWLSTLDFGEFMNPGAVPSFSEGYQSVLPVLVPPLPEQRAIAAFLDRETGRVDRLVAKKRELIERLQEKRTALISRTVTRGLPAAAALATGLPANPPLKPSGTEWLGHIPEHWEVKKGRYVGILFGSVSPSEDEFIEDDSVLGGDLPFAKVDDLNQIDGSLKLVSTKARVRGCRARLGAFLLFPKRGAAIFTNKVAIAEQPLLFDPNLMGWQINSAFAVKFVAYCLIARRLDDLADVSTVPQINNKHIYPAAFPRPPLSEQTAIAAYLDSETAKLDALVEKVEEAVERLQEYRTALITAAVTGKIDVRKAESQVA
jgi:type I restriction enzyme S subunit